MYHLPLVLADVQVTVALLAPDALTIAKVPVDGAVVLDAIMFVHLLVLAHVRVVPAVADVVVVVQDVTVPVVIVALDAPLVVKEIVLADAAAIVVVAVKAAPEDAEADVQDVLAVAKDVQDVA